ncbi:MAG: PPOX class F420-dependent oxidoreductase, partial [Sciscionella sp.]
PRFCLCVDDDAPPFSFVQMHAEASLRDCGTDPAATLPHSIVVAERYMGADLARTYGQRNNVPGEYQVRGRITKVVALAGIAD